MNPPRGPGDSLSALLWRLARTDSIALLTLITFALVTALYVAPFLTEDPRAVLYGSGATDLPFFALALLACRVGLSRLERDEERRFWTVLSAAYAYWMLAAIAEAFLADRLSPVVLHLTLETLYAAYYAGFVVAVAGQPHLPGRPRAGDTAWSWLAIATLIFGLFAYFVAVPALLGARAYAGGFSSTYLYPLLDALLALRLAVLARRVDSRRWRRLYSLLAVTAALSLVNDVQSGDLAPDCASFWDVPGALLWNLQFVPLVLAARLRHALPAGCDRRVEDARGAPRYAELREQTLAFTVGFPALHFTLYASGALDETIRPAREASMLVWLLAMAAVALIQHRLLEASRRSLERDTGALAAEISERKELEARRQAVVTELERKKQAIEAKNAELERFTGAISRDLKSPLIAIGSSLESVEESLDSEELDRIAEPLKQVDAAACRMARLLEELLEPRPIAAGGC